MSIWGFPYMVVPPNSWMVNFMEKPIEMDDDWGVPPFQETSI